MTNENAQSDNLSETAVQTFGRKVYDLLLARYGHPVLSSCQSIQQLKSSDRQAAVTLLFGADAALSERFQQIDPDGVFTEIVGQVERMKTMTKVQGDTATKTTVLSGLLEFLGNTLPSIS